MVSRPAGSLSQFINNWLAIEAPEFIVEIIKGYKIEFSQTPVQCQIPSQKSFTQLEMTEMNSLIKTLLEIDAISKCKNEDGQFLSNVFLVPKPNGKYRFILNLKELNTFVANEKFKMEDLRTAINLLTPGAYMTSIDLKDAYYSVPIHPSCRKFLRFTWNGNLYEFNCLPFGLCTAPRIFTKIMRVVSRHLRKQGIALVTYLDDILTISSNFKISEQNTNYILKLLFKLGFNINFDKSHLTPSTNIKFLGFMLDTCSMSIALPSEKRESLRRKCHAFIQQDKCTILALAEILGHMVAASPAIPYALLYTKRLEREKFLALSTNSDNYHAIIKITDHMKEDLAWWYETLAKNFVTIRQDSFDLEIFSDASLQGWGASSNGQSTGGSWSVEEACMHINYLELVAAYYALRCYAKDMQNKQILMFIDNTTAISYINKMGSIQHPHLYEITRRIWQFCERHKLWVYANYIPSKENIEADRESRNIETEWCMSEAAYFKICKEFGSPDIDLFASKSTHKCQRYCSWRPDPYAFHVNAFTLEWKTISFYAFPPFNIISRVLRKIKHDKAEGIVVAPLWESQPWFPIFISLIKAGPIILKPNPKLIMNDSRSHPLWRKLHLIVAVLSGKLSEERDSRNLNLLN